MKLETQEQKNIFVVLGMARSGTSAIAKGLNALGVEFGNHLTPAREMWNPKGFWEDNDIVYKVNRGVLFAIDHSWMSFNLIQQNYQGNERLQNLRQYTIDLLKQRMASTHYFGFKDPRTAKILPFWQEIFRSMNLRENYIIALRNPLASAYSYQRVSGADLEEGLLLWLMHLIPAIDGTQGKKRLMVSYEKMLQNPSAQLERIQKAFSLSHLSNEADIAAYANEFLDKKLRHFDYDMDHLKTHPAAAIIPVCYKMYDLFVKLASDEISFDSEAFTTTWQEVKIEFEKIYPIYCYLETLQIRNKEMEREVRTIKKSLPWKIVYPLRIIDDALRSLRKRRKEKRRLMESYGRA